MDRREVNLAIFLDLEKAFHAVDHTILLAKLEKYGRIPPPPGLLR